MKSSRRRFLKLLATGSAAAATPGLARAAAASRRAAARRPAHPPAPAATPAATPPAALRAEIARQQRDLDKTLKTLRDHPLEPGSDPAFVFTPRRATRTS